MKKLFRPYLAILLMGAMAATTTACDDDDEPAAESEQEMITTVTLSLVPSGKGQSVTATWKDADGITGSQQPTIDVLNLAPNTTYTGTLTILDESKTPAANISQEVEAEGDEHELFYTTTVPGVTIATTDVDKNNRPLGLKTTVTTTATGTGEVRILLKHQPGQKGATSDPNKGETDIDVKFNTVVQ
ncbi:hypothetical protein [Pontibacter ruber]|uniref:Type 1 periplasmic binding fold superfamily protein n=1 Tax=Pontibacter ruber TaxID=1343895 RepID=A0ABW5CWV4_9BACT|nr:hypothetical protein [Pontibacter ruber]